MEFFITLEKVEDATMARYIATKSIFLASNGKRTFIFGNFMWAFEYGQTMAHQGLHPHA